MPVLLGAVAYRAKSIGAADQHTNGSRTRDYEGAMTKEVSCPRCGELYTLFEEGSVAEDLIQEDLNFLAKALSTGHPQHPAYMVVRDPDGLLPTEWSML